MLSKRNIYPIGIAILIFLTGLFVVNLFWYRPFFIQHFFWKEMILSLRDEPQIASHVHIPLFFKKSQFQLNDISIESFESRKEHLERYSAMLQRYQAKNLSRARKLDKRVIQWHLDQDLKSMDFILFENLLNPFSGQQATLPLYLAHQHSIESKKDAEAYLERVRQFPEQLKSVKNRLKLAQSAGIIPPKKLIQQSILQMEAFRRTEAENSLLYLEFKNKLDSLKRSKYKDKMLAELISLIQNEVYPAYDNLIIYARKLHQEAPLNQALSTLPGGSEYYHFLIPQNSTLDLTPDSLYTLANAEISRLKNEMVQLLRNLGKECSPKNVEETWEELSKTPGSVMGNSIQSRISCKKQLDSLLTVSKSYVEDHLFVLPELDVKIKRVPEFRDFWCDFSFYQNPSVNRKGTGWYYFSMNALDHLPVYHWPSMTQMATYPGMHFLKAYNLDNSGVPAYRKRFTNRAYTEGWSLYAAQLMSEEGYYQNNTLEYLALLNDQLFKAATMAADIGMHHKNWSRDNAIVFLANNSTLDRRRINVEVDRIIAKPGEALSPTIGFITFMKLRERSKKALEDSFNLAEFHQVILENGVLPLFILEDIVNEYIEKKYDKKGS